jgi:hypothetical protein
MDDLKLNYRYFEKSKYSCCSLIGISIGFREINDTIEIGLAIRSVKDNHNRKIAKEVINKRFKQNQILIIPIPNNFKNAENTIRTGHLRNRFIIRVFMALYNYHLIDPKPLGLIKLPAGELTN